MFVVRFSLFIFKMSPTVSYGSVLVKSSNAMMGGVYHRYGFVMVTTIVRRMVLDCHRMKLIAMHAFVLKMNSSTLFVMNFDGSVF